MYIILALTFFLTLICGLLTILGLIFKSKYRFRFAGGFACWLLCYSLFIIFGTGPVGSRLYHPSTKSPYKLPWENGISRFVSQGNRSFTSHRDKHLYAWDFWMPIGTKVLASRGGKVVEIEDSFEGIGLESNFVLIEHEDGSKALYAHIKKDGATIQLGQNVDQGQLIAYSGMVGQTINPHLHFVVLNKEGTESLPVNFSDVPDGLPLAGHAYTSGNR